MILHRRRWQQYVGYGLAIALIFWLVSSGFTPLYDLPASAQSVEELKQQRQQVDQEIKRQSETRDRYQKAEEQSKTQMRNLSKTIQGTDAWISDTEYQLSEAQEQLKQLEKDLERNRLDYESGRTAVVGRLQFMQRQQGSQGWALLLQSQNLNDFLDRRYRLKQVYQADRVMLVELEDKSTQILAQQEGVEQQKNSISLLRQQLLASRQQYTEQLQQQSVTTARLKENKGALAAAISRLDQDSDNITELILEKVAAAQAADSKMAREEALRAARVSGKMMYPSQGPITSQFGSRFHPVLGYSRFHAGTDFGADTGTPIQAAETGIVIFSGWYGGYGNAVILDHGGGMTTLYGHASRLNVSEGETAKKGDAIAAIGSTGLSTGPHLHFEVRRNGEPVDPMNYLG
ncbi:MAG: peptidase M23 [Leptolyngbya foveolarum]|uniref:Peptidase M23 n=1 Tax=Leptolyngbya foveolarum TaxID=47253 RepID=A0A2W4TJ99_9CYAN|nr:MAG: peptidase M23 [Leptolyngbya foveolarum]